VRSFQAFDKVLAGLPLAYPGPGGAVAVLREGEVIARHTWGFADLEKRIAFTPETLFRICSISKQFTCAAMLDRHPDPGVLDADILALLPNLQQSAPAAVDLAHNQSGLRDYWAVAMLHGSPIEAAFGEAETRAVISGTRTLQFAPGMRYSYCNQNFRMLGDVVAARAGLGYGDLLRKYVFDPAGMPTAQVCADTSAMPDGTVGYEGAPEPGFRPAVNNIFWTGDAGLGASLDDMIAWERFIDSTRDDESGVYRRLSAPVTFRDGAEAFYGFGLVRVNLLGRVGTGHGGGLRGWRSFRFNLPAERISIVVLFNHMDDPRAAGLDLLATLIEAPPKAEPKPAGVPWKGVFREPETGLSARVDTVGPQTVKLQFGHGPETLDVVSDDLARSGTVALRREGESVWMDRGADNQSSHLVAAEGTATPDIEGRYICAELDASFVCVAAGGALYGRFAGFLGEGVMQLLTPLAADLWLLSMPRALDHTAPGDWTLGFRRDAAGKVAAVQIGCWLARGLEYVRAD